MIVFQFCVLLLISILLVCFFIKKDESKHVPILPDFVEFYNSVYRNRFETISTSKNKMSPINHPVDELLPTRRNLQIYGICLPDRKKYLVKTLQKEGIENFLIFNAITPSNISNTQYEKLSFTFDEKSPLFKKPTKLAVHLSYLCCMYHAFLNNYEYIFIFEDDIFFQVPLKNMKDTIDEFLQNSEMQLLYLGYCFRDCHVPFKKKFNKIYQIQDSSSVLCTHAIIHNTNYFEHFFNYLKKMNIFGDKYFDEYYRKNKIKRTVVKKSLITQSHKKFNSKNGNINWLSDCKFILF